LNALILRTLFVLAIIFSVYDSAAQEIWATDSGFVEFTSRVPFFEFNGQSEQVTGQINAADSTVDFYVDLETLRTGNGKRDKDMRITLNTHNHPFAEFYGKLLTPFDSAIQGQVPASVSGLFTLNGISRPIVIDGSLDISHDEIRLEASWILRLDDYSIQPPKLLVLKVDQDQSVSLSVVLKPVNK